MGAIDQELEVLEAWQRLPSAETEAIEAGDWIHLATLQRAKGSLGQRLQALSAEGDRRDPGIASRVAALMAHERANLDLIQRRRARAETDQAVVEQSRWNLRRQMGSFGKRRTPTWNQYS